MLVSSTDEPLGQSPGIDKGCLIAGDALLSGQAREIHSTSTRLHEQPGSQDTFLRVARLLSPWGGPANPNSVCETKKGTRLPLRATTQGPCCALEVAMTP